MGNLSNLNTTELLQRVRKIEIKARGLSQELFAGQYKTAFKGQGMTFSEVREYQIGDSVRNIDWNVTARHDHTYIKVFEEERELTVMLLIDMSASLAFGTYCETKGTLVAELAATLAFSAIDNKDNVGVILFTDKVEKYIPPGKGKRHILYIIREILSFNPQAKGSAPEASLAFLNRIVKKHANVFIISDFMIEQYREEYYHALKIAAQKHHLSAIVVHDRREEAIPSMGLVRFEDLETGATRWVNTSSRRVRRLYESGYLQARNTRRKLLHQHGIDYVEVATGDDFAKALITLFAKR